MERLQQLGVIGVYGPVALQTLKERLGHMLEVTPNVEIVQCHLILALQVKMLEHKVLR